VILRKINPPITQKSQLPTAKTLSNHPFAPSHNLHLLRHYLTETTLKFTLFYAMLRPSAIKGRFAHIAPFEKLLFTDLSAVPLR
jgi:hypothetical protein